MKRIPPKFKGSRQPSYRRLPSWAGELRCPEEPEEINSGRPEPFWPSAFLPRNHIQLPSFCSRAPGLSHRALRSSHAKGLLREGQKGPGGCKESRRGPFFSHFSIILRRNSILFLNPLADVNHPWNLSVALIVDPSENNLQQIVS